MKSAIFLLFSVAAVFADQSVISRLVAEDVHLGEMLQKALSASPSRVKRDVDAEFQHEMCCGSSKNAAVFKNADSVKKCEHIMKESNYDEMVASEDKMLETFDCYSLCIGKIDGTCDAKGAVDVKALSNHMKEHYDDDLGPLIEKITKACSDEMAKEAKKYPNAKCNKHIGHTIFCTVHLIDIVCPASHQVKSKKCDALRKKYNDSHGM